MFLQTIFSLNVLLLVLRDEVTFEFYLLERLLILGVGKGRLLAVHLLFLLNLNDGLLQARNGVISFFDLLLITFDLFFLFG